MKNKMKNGLAAFGRFVVSLVNTPYESVFGYMKRHIGRILLSLVLAVFPTYVFVFNTFSTISRNYKNVFNDIVNSTEFSNAAWGTFFIYLPIMIAIYFIFCFGGDRENSEKPNTVYTAVTLLIGLAAAGAVLHIKQTEIYDCVDTFLTHNRAACYFQFLGALGIVTFSWTWMKFAAFIKNGDAYRHPWFVKTFMCLFSAVMSFVVLEVQIGSHLNIDPKMIFFNILYWVIAWIFFYAIFRSVRGPSAACVLIGWGIGCANFCVLQFRGNYIMSGDLTVIGTAMEVAGKYKLKINTYFVLAILLVVCSLALIYNVPKIKTDVKRGFARRSLTTVITIGALAACVIPSFKSGLLYNDIFGLVWDYNKKVDEYGYLPYFFSNMHATARIDMSDYDSDKAKSAMDTELAASGSAVKVTGEDVKEPTIIVIQDETFSDLSVVADIKTDKPVMPYIDSLTENTHKGYVNMSVTGGPTANTEFEMLTQTPMTFMPTGSVPYTQYLKKKIPSIVEVLHNQTNPYKAIAFHPYYSSGYNRNSVYDLIGFDEKVFYEDFSDKEQLRGLVTDEQDFKDVISMYENHKLQNPDQPLFIFNVSIQSHGGYSNNKVYFDDPVEITNFDSVQALDNYESLMRTTDDALHTLLGYFEKVDEPVIILFYGDHQPSFDTDATDELLSHSWYKDATEQKLSRYIVPYFIWANYDIGSSDGIKDKGTTGDFNAMSMNYMGALLLHYAGVETTEYEEYLLKLHESVPAITALGYWDAAGKHYESTETSELTDKLSGYRNVTYNLLFDSKDKLNEYFLPRE